MPSKAEIVARAEKACLERGIDLPEHRSIYPAIFALGRLTGWTVRGRPERIGGGWVAVRIDRHGNVQDVDVSSR